MDDVLSLHGRALELPDDVTVDGARRIVRDGTPENTRLAYSGDRRYVEAWCRARGFGAELPMSQTVAITFIVDHVDGPPSEVDRVLVASGVKRDFGPHAVTTIRRRVAALSIAHRLAGYPSPFTETGVKDLLAKARRASVARGWRQKQAAAVDRETLDAMLETCGEDIAGLRDRALLLFGFSSGGRRRSEIVGAMFHHLTPIGQDYRFDMGRSKTNQEGDDDPKPVKGRASRALRAWLEASGISEGPVFRGVDRHGNVSQDSTDGRTVSEIVKRRARLAGLDPTKFSGHSLRSGFVTECGRQGVALMESMALAGHVDPKTAIRYYRAGEVMRSVAGNVAG